MDQVARAVLILELTDSAVMLSLVVAARMVPLLIFGLLAGAVADRYDRRRILMLTQSVSFSTHLLLAVLLVGGWISAWHVFATALIAGTAMSFNQPVRQSLIPASVPREDLMNAVALNSMSVSFMRIGGGALAGVLLIFLSTGGVYFVNAGIYVFVIGTTMLMRFPAAGGANRPKVGILADLREGFAYVAANRTLALVIGMALILFIFGFPYQQVFVPLLATETLDLGRSGVGYLAGAIGVGAVVGSFLVMARSQISRPLFQMTLNLFVFGGILIAISIQDSLVVTAVLLGVSGALVTSYMALANGVLLSQSDPQMLGRVMSLMSLDRGLIPLGAILAGVLVSGIGIQPGLFTMGAVMVTLSGGVLLLFGRQISQLGEMEPRSVEERAETPSAEDMPAKDMSAGKAYADSTNGATVANGGGSADGAPGAAETRAVETSRRARISPP